MQKTIMLSQGWELSDRDRLSMVIAEVKERPIEEILAKYGVKPERYIGNRILALCPFHLDEHIGSFSIDTEKGICWCFACNQGGDAINSMSKVWRKSYVDTALQIGADLGILTPDEYLAMSGKDYTDSFQDKKADYKPIAQERKRPDTTTLETWTKAYEFMRDWFGLTDDDRAELKGKRCLSDERIDSDYFSIDTSDPKTVARLIFDMRSRFPEIRDQLPLIPGFYEELRNGRYQVSMFIHRGIGMVLRNAQGQAIAVQVRSREEREDKSSRYRYLSYRCPKGSKTQRGGGTVGTPVDTLFPSKYGKRTRIAIVEGRFKSEILAQNGFISLSVQGVNNYSGIEKDIEDAINLSGKDIDDIYVFYDADQLRNGAVYNAGVKLSRYLKEKTDKDVYFVIWDPGKGKGIDDLILSGHKDDAKPVAAKVYEEVYREAHDAAERGSGLDLRNLARLSKDDRSGFYDIFERETRKRFGL